MLQLHSIGTYFTQQLLESRHRGAFELAYAGFVQMTERLWNCTLEGVHELPRKWLEEVISKVRVHDPCDQLCSTRRSAGVPFYIQVHMGFLRLCFRKTKALTVDCTHICFCFQVWKCFWLSELIEHFLTVKLSVLLC